MKLRILATAFMVIGLHMYATQELPVLSHGLPFNKVVVWGHKLHSHTHSYIHAGFVKAFQYLGYPVHWLDNNDDIRAIDFSHALFITEGQVDQKIPLRSDCLYILHNCAMEKYKKLFDSGHAMIMQVYTHDVLGRKVYKVDECQYTDIENKMVYMPWATDLLPYEIDEIKKQLPSIKKNNVARFIGTCGGGSFGNIDKADAFKKACRESGIGFEVKARVDLPEHIKLIESAYVAPTLVGQWQCEKGYIPCRIFKNISYGSLGITNSEAVYNLFDKKIVYNPDCYQLCFDALKKAKNTDINEIFDLMDVVKTKHTYLNRIDLLLSFFSLVYEQPNKKQSS